MYDWPECRSATDALWSQIRQELRAAGIPAPERLARRNGDLPAVPGGIRDARGRLIAADPATLPPDEFDLEVLWRHPALVFAQTCWGPMEAGLSTHVEVTGQPDYSPFRGGQGRCYRSAIVVRGDPSFEAPVEAGPVIAPDRIAGRRFAYNDARSMSGLIAPRRDLVVVGAIADENRFDSFWSAMMNTGSHRESIIAVASGKADVAAIDCRTWAMALEHEPACRELSVVGWTAPRPGLPYVRSKHMAPAISGALQRVADRL